MHATPSHFHHDEDLFTCNEHMRWKILESFVNAYLLYSLFISLAVYGIVCVKLSIQV